MQRPMLPLSELALDNDFSKGATYPNASSRRWNLSIAPTLCWTSSSAYNDTPQLGLVSRTFMPVGTAVQHIFQVDNDEEGNVTQTQIMSVNASV
ncbi:hypothetical protein R3P38DRAFT_2889503, partial [Favolaschia claudopus]